VATLGLEDAHCGFGGDVMDGYVDYIGGVAGDEVWVQ
jgi:hypothetical protein